MSAIPAPVGSTSSEEAGGRLASLFDAHGRMVLGLCRFLLRDADEADDATQQTFLSAYRSLLGGTEPRNPGPWLAEIARHECQHRIAARMREPLPLAPTVEATGDDPAEAADQTELIRELKTAIAELPDRQREAVILRDFYGLSYREVATVMTVSVPVVESLLFRARRHLGRRLGTLPRLAQGALVVPLAVREELARAVPGFDAAVAGLGITGAAAGIIAKLAALPASAKVATATSVAAVAVGGATVTPQPIDRHPERAKRGSTATNPSPASEASGPTGSTQPVGGAVSFIAETQHDGVSSDQGRKSVKAGSKSIGPAGRKESDDRDEREDESESLEAPESEEESAESEAKGEGEGEGEDEDEVETEDETEEERPRAAVTPTTRSESQRVRRETDSVPSEPAEQPTPDEDEDD